MFFLPASTHGGRGVKGQTMTTHEIVRACVPRGTGDKLARVLCKSAETINRWGRPPMDDDDSPAGTGAFNPLDWVEAIQDHAFAHAPREAHRLHQYFSQRYENFASAFSTKTLTPELRDKELADVIRENSEMMQAVLTALPADRVRAEWEQLKREGEELVRLIENQSVGAIHESPVCSVQDGQSVGDAGRHLFLSNKKNVQF